MFAWCLALSLCTGCAQPAFVDAAVPTISRVAVETGAGMALWPLAQTTASGISPAAPGPEEPTGLSGAVGLLPRVVAAFAKGQYAMGAGLVLTLLVWLIRTYAWAGAPKRLLPWLSLLLAAATAAAAALLSGLSPLQAALNGLTAGVSAVGFWELYKSAAKKEGGAS